MSYNIDNCDEETNEAWMMAFNVIELLKKHEGGVPACNFLEAMKEDALKALTEGEPQRKIKLPHANWYGEFSGTSYNEVFQKSIAPRIGGKLAVILTWEGGDSVSAYTIEDGVFEECDVEMKIVKRKKG